MSESYTSWSAGSATFPDPAASAVRELNMVTDIVVATAFLSIPVLLFYIARRRRDFRSLPLLIAGSVLAVCVGLASLLHLGSYRGATLWIDAIIGVVAAVAAVVVATLLWKALPAIVRMPSTRQLRATNESLARATRELEAFTASVSHDLRSPLTTIAGQAGLLELSLGESASDDQRRRLQRIQGSVRQLSELLDALLILSRISQHTLHREIVDISALAEEAIAELRQNDPGRTVQVKIQPGISVHGDRRLIGDLIANMLGNAWKFTSKTADSSIEFTATSSGHMATLRVRDNGAGFDMAYAQKLFKPFQRLHGQAEFSGSGIGLATVSRIVERHGGRIWAESQPQQGATFYFTLPTMPMTNEFLVGPRAGA